MAEKLSGKKIVMIVANEYEDIELLYPLLRLSEEGAEIIVVPVPMGNHPRPWLENKPVTGRFGHPVPIPVMPEGRRHSIRKIEELQASDIDCLLFPGGFSPDALRRHPETLELIRQCYQQGKLVAAICHAPWILISAGLMKGKRATSFSAVKDDLINAGAEFVDEPVVRDGTIITSRTPLDLPEFCLEIIQALKSN
jgi:protease I